MFIFFIGVPFDKPIFRCDTLCMKNLMRYGKEYRDFLINIAHMYYVGQMTQEEIAETLHFSRAKVARMLKDARDKKIVSFRIETPDSYYDDLAACIRSHFSLKHVSVIPTQNTESSSKQAAADAAGRYLKEILHNNMTIGICWGSTVCVLAKRMPELPLQGCSVYALSANIASQNYSFDSYAIISDFASSLHASKHIINAPYVVQNKQMRDLLFNEPSISDHFSHLKNMDVAIIGLGTNIPEESTAYQNGSITLEEVHALHEQGADADIVGHRLYADGTPADTNITDRVISVSLQDLKNTPHVLAIAVGKEKSHSAIAAAKGRFYTDLFIDEEAALSIIAKEEINHQLYQQ